MQARMHNIVTTSIQYTLVACPRGESTRMQFLQLLIGFKENLLVVLRCVEKRHGQSNLRHKHWSHPVDKREETMPLAT